MLEFLGGLFIVYYLFMVLVGYKACRRGGHTATKALVWGLTWPHKAYAAIHSAYK